jgi:phage terminase large subunit GpA-like protein
VKQEPLRTRNWEWSEADQCGYALCTECGERAVSNEHAGFQASKIFSPVITMAELAKAWLEAKDDPETKQVFINTQLAEPFQLEAMRKVATNSLAARRETFADQVPDGVLTLTCGVDVQTGGEVNEGRLEIEVVGWGAGFESWSIDYKVIEGDPSSPEVWAQLDRYLTTDFIDSRGYPRRIEATCIDTGGGSTETVYKYCSERVRANVWGIKGKSEISANWSPVWPPTKYNPKRTRVGYKPIMLGVSAAKEAIREFLIIETPGPGFCHFPKDRPEIYFEQLTAENLVFEYRGGKTLKKWVQPKGRANEALDCRVYAYGALRGLMVVRNLNFSIRAEMLATVGMKHVEKLNSPTPATPNRVGQQVENPRIRRSKYMA